MKNKKIETLIEKNNFSDGLIVGLAIGVIASIAVFLVFF